MKKYFDCFMALLIIAFIELWIGVFSSLMYEYGYILVAKFLATLAIIIIIIAIKIAIKAIKCAIQEEGEGNEG